MTSNSRAGRWHWYERRPSLPSDDAPARQPRPAVGTPDEESWLHRQVTELAADPRLMEAVDLASASLAADVARVVAGERLRLKSLRRIAVSLTKYHSRMSTVRPRSASSRA